MEPQVRGRVVRQHPALIPGGYIPEGQELVGIDPSDYELALTEQVTSLEEAQFELEVELGRQVVALREWGLLEGNLAGGEVNRSLVLREPHLRRAEAMIRKATNEISKARLNMSRTSVIAPFNAMVLAEAVELGQLLEPGGDICTLVGTDEFWVQASLPLEKLKWIRLPGPHRPGAAAKILLDTGNGAPAIWPGVVVRLLSDLEPAGRMARVLIRVGDPLGLEDDRRSFPLLLGSFVQVEIDAGQLTNVLMIPRGALREGNMIWVMDANRELQIRPVEILWSRLESLYIANDIRPDDALIVSGLKVALPGMKVEPIPTSAGTLAPAPEDVNAVHSGE
jgi:RND family efflux transporter MFP subunit